MILTETNLLFPLSSVKPFEQLVPYQQFCIAETKKALKINSVERTTSPVGQAPLVKWGSIEGLEYLECPETGSLFLKKVSDEKTWDGLLQTVAEKRNSSNGFHQNVAGSRASNVYIPKLEWIESSLRLNGLKNVSALEIKAPLSKFSSLFKSSSVVKDVESLSEAQFYSDSLSKELDVAVLFESCDRSIDPKKLMNSVWSKLKPGGLIFVTSLVSSGFDVSVVGDKNLYLTPPDRTNCFSLAGLEILMKDAGFELIEISTPGVLDVEIVEEHLKKYPELKLSGFEKKILSGDDQTKRNFQSFLQRSGLSSFARLIGRKK